MILQKLLALFCFISVGFSAYDTIPFKHLDGKLAEAGVPQELLPMNHHTAAQRVKNVRFIFGVGQSLSFYPYPKAVNFDKLLFPQSYVAAFVEMLFPNPHMFAANQSPDAIAKIPFRNLGLLARHLVTAEYVAAIDTFANAINLGTNSSSTPQNFDETALLEFQRISFYQEIRRQIQEQFDAMVDEEDDNYGDFFKNVAADKKIAHIIKSQYPELLPHGADLIEDGFFDDRSKPAITEKDKDKELRNKSFIITLQKAIAKVQPGTTTYTESMLVEAINTFAWQKFKTTDDILDYYKGITNSEELDLDFETFSFEQIRHASRLLEAEPEHSSDLDPHFRAVVIKHTVTEAAPLFSGVKYRSASYSYKSSSSSRNRTMNFADCVESQLRAFLMGISRTTTELGTIFEGKVFPDGSPITIFFEKFPLPEHITMQEAHDSFATLIANKGSETGIIYLSPKHHGATHVAEVSPGILNLLKALSYLSGTQLSSSASSNSSGTSREATRTYIDSYLQALSTNLSRTDFTLEFECDSFLADITYDRKLNDFTGKIAVKVNSVPVCLLVCDSGHGELKPLVKQKPTWIDCIPTVGAEFEALPDDLKHYVYQRMPSETLSTLVPELQRKIILGSTLDDLDAQIDSSIHCFSQSNPLVRELALPTAHKILKADDNKTTKTFISKLCILIKSDSSCITEAEFRSLAVHENFLSATLEIEDEVDNKRSYGSVMPAYGYKKGWLDEASFYKIEHLSFGRWETLHEFFDVTPFSNTDYVNILRMPPNLESLDECHLSKDHASATQFVSAIAQLPKLTSLNINLSDHTASNPFLARICKLPKTLETLNIRGDLFDKSAQSVLIEVAIDCVKYLPALKYLSMNVESEEMLRSVLPILRTEGLPTERIAIDCLYSGDSQIYRTRVSGIYQEVLGHEYPENH